MLPRMFTRFLQHKCILQVIHPWKISSFYIARCLISFTPTPRNLKQEVRSTSSTINKDLLKPGENEDHMIPKITPSTGAVFPSIRPTKTARIFESIATNLANEEGFNQAIAELQKKDLKKHRVTEFIPTGLAYMDAFGVSKNLDTYNNLLGLFPTGRYHYRTVFDTIWTRYRPQIDTAVLLLTKMEDNGVRPNVDTYDMVEAIFGVDSIPMNKLKRIVYWFDKFDTMYPDPLPQELPTDKMELFTLALQRMFGDTAPITYHKDSTDHTMIVSTHTPDFEEKLDEHDEQTPLFVEGPFHAWMRNNILFYYVLQVKVSHQDELNSVVAVCFLDGNDDSDHLKQWLNELQKNFPSLEKLNIIFNITETKH